MTGHPSAGPPRPSGPPETPPVRWPRCPPPPAPPASAADASRAELLAAPLPELLARAAAARDAAFGTRMTFSPKVFIPLTMLCRDRCGYCTFAKAPARLESPYLSDRRGPGDRPGRAGRRVPRGAVHPGRRSRGPLPGGRRVAGGARLRLDGGLPGRRLCRRARAETGLLPHANAGALGTRRTRRAPDRVGEPGDDARVDEPRPRRPPRRRRTRRRPVGSPPSRTPAGWPSPSPPDCWSASASRARTASTRSKPLPPATPATATSRR